jgi:hypothetical protein
LICQVYCFYRENTSLTLTLSPRWVERG